MLQKQTVGRGGRTRVDDAVQVQKVEALHHLPKNFGDELRGKAQPQLRGGCRRLRGGDVGGFLVLGLHELLAGDCVAPHELDLVPQTQTRAVLHQNAEAADWTIAVEEAAWVECYKNAVNEGRASHNVTKTK